MISITKIQVTRHFVATTSCDSGIIIDRHTGVRVARYRTHIGVSNIFRFSNRLDSHFKLVGWRPWLWIYQKKWYKRKVKPTFYKEFISMWQWQPCSCDHAHGQHEHHYHHHHHGHQGFPIPPAPAVLSIPTIANRFRFSVWLFYIFHISYQSHCFTSQAITVGEDGVVRHWTSKRRRRTQRVLMDWSQVWNKGWNKKSKRVLLK